MHEPCDFNDLIKDDPIEFVAQFRDYLNDPFICSLLAAYMMAATQGKLEFLETSALVLYPGVRGWHNIPWRKGTQENLMDIEIQAVLGQHQVALRNATRWFSLAMEGRRAESIKNASGTTLNGHAYVDLGLSVKWATCNVGASSPEQYGNYYAWGETSTKSEYTDSNSKTCDNSSYNFDIGGNVSLDAARANWGGTWRLPTADECRELLDECTWTWTTLGGKNGYRVTGPSGKSIFLPAAGGRYGSSLNYAGDYWTSTPNDFSAYFAQGLLFNSSARLVFWDYRNNGFSVRPVSE